MKRVLTLAIFTLAFCFSIHAQAGGSTAEIRGRISDPNGAVVAVPL
jgi:hypothetical protein